MHLGSGHAAVIPVSLYENPKELPDRFIAGYYVKGGTCPWEEKPQVHSTDLTQPTPMGAPEGHGVGNMASGSSSASG